METQPTIDVKPFLESERERKRLYYLKNRERIIAKTAARNAAKKAGIIKPVLPRIDEEILKQHIDNVVLATARIVDLKSYDDLNKVRYMSSLFGRIRLILSEYVKSKTQLMVPEPAAKQ